MKVDSNINYLSGEELKKELYRLLLEFDAFCRKNDLKYSLYSGTLLGAVRHGGFIPWDDDVDVCMPRPDYERMLSLAHTLPERFELLSTENSPLILPFAKFCDKEYRAQEDIFEGILEEHLWLDIFPFDGIEADEEQGRNHFLFLQKLLRKRMRCSFDPDYTSHSKPEALLKRVYKALTLASEPLSKQDQKIRESQMRISFDEAQFISNYSYPNNKPWRIEKDKFVNYTEMKFEQSVFPVMGNWDEYLKSVYGDYMTLPPEDKRRVHLVKVWKV